ncbi:MAG: TonB-dependent receptor [Bacteroidota bacterium]
MFLSTRSFLLITLLLFATPILSAQQGSGQIKGTITDATTGEALIGANVTIKSTSLGAPSDVDGKYIINAIPSGSYTVKVSYIGYRSKEMTIEVKEGSTHKLNFSLVSQTLEGEEVIVTAQARGQKAAINQQLTSNTIINVVSAEKIQQLPDANASTALSRLPGVSLMNGDQIVIRGVQAKMNQILINGIELPSTDMGSNTSTTSTRATNLGFISSNLLSGIEVVKALTPDMDANTIGGVVNLRLREAPTGLHFDALTQGNYNASDHVTDNYTFWASISDRFFNDKLGVFVQGNLDRSDGGDQKASITPTLLGTSNNAYGQATYESNGANFEYDDNIITNRGGSLILDYQLPNGKIVLQNTYSGNVTDQLNNYILLNFDLTQVTYTPDRSLYGKDLWINALQVENTFGIIKVNAGLSHSFSQQYTEFGYSPSLNGNSWSQFYNSGAAAPFGFDASSNPIRYNSSAAEQGMTLTNALGVFNNINQAEFDSSSIQGWTQSIANQFRQHLYNASLDVSAPVNFSNDITATFKAGGKYMRTTRENNVDENFAHGPGDTYANPDANNYFGSPALGPGNPLRFAQVMDNNFARGQYYLNSLYNFTNGGFKYALDRNKYDAWLKLSEEGWAFPIQYADSYKNDWNGAEQSSAGYLMGTFNFGPQLTLIGGARFESYNMIYHAQFTYVTHTVYGDCVSTENGSIGDTVNPVNPYHNVPYSAFNVDRTDNNVFPDVQLQYKVNDWSDLRFAYTTGISRPDYTAIIPKVTFDIAGDFAMGNPMLKPATSQSYDVVGSIHTNSIGLLTIDAFYKEIKNQMYNTSIYYSSLSQYASNVYIPDSTFLAQGFGFTVLPQYLVAVNLNNPNLGYIRGVEIDWEANFWYLPRPLNALVLDINYTHSGSNTAYTVIQNIDTKGRDSRGHVIDIFTSKDTTYDGRLIQQANDVVNAAIGVDYKGFSGRISFSMIGNVINSVGLRPEESSFTGNTYRWDFTLKQDLPIDGLSITLNGINIFHQGINTYRNYRMSPDAPITQNLVSVLYPITQFQLNLRYSI